MKLSKLKIISLIIVFNFLYTFPTNVEEADFAKIAKITNIISTQPKEIKAWENIQKMYFPSLENLPKKQPAPTEKQRKPDLLRSLLTDLSENEKIKTGLSILKNMGQEPTDKIMDDATFENLHIFCGIYPDLDRNLVKITDNTNTIAGRLCYLELLYNPTNNKKSLLDRQNAIKLLIENVELYKNLASKIKELSKFETELISNFGKREKAINELLKSFYSKIFLPKLPTPENTLKGYTESINNWLKDVEKKLSEITSTSPNWLEFKRLFSLVGNPLLFLSKQKYLFTSKAIELSFTRPVTFIGSSSIQKTLRRAAIFSVLSFMPDEYKNNIQRIFLAFEALSQAYGIYKKMTINEEVYNVIEQTMQNIVKFIQITQDIKKLIKDNQVLLLAIDPENKFNYEQSNIDYEFFKSKSSTLIKKGKILAEFEKFKNLGKIFSKEYYLIGKVDALLSIVKLYKKFENKNLKWNFANYIDKEKSFIELKDFWPIFVNYKKAISNNITLGDTLPRGIILTGPNAGGKSTILTSAGIASFCTQTLTIAPGQISLKPFKKIVKLSDFKEIPGKLSLFQAHQQRVDETLNTLNSINKNDPVLILIDELYNSTAENVATALAYGTYKVFLRNYPGVILLGTTHFTSLGKLEKDPQLKNLIKNWKIEEAKFNSYGAPVWSHKIQPGINKQNIGILLFQKNISTQDIAKEAGQALTKLYTIKGLDPEDFVNRRARKQLIQLSKEKSDVIKKCGKLVDEYRKLEKENQELKLKLNR